MFSARGGFFSQPATQTVTLTAINCSETATPPQGYAQTNISLSGNPSGVTFAMLINPKLTPTRDSPFTIFSAGTPGMATFVETTGQIRWFFRATNGNAIDLRVATGSLTANVWNQVMFSADFANNVTATYVNGTSVSYTQTTWQGNLLPGWNGVNSIGIGRADNPQGAGYDVNGDIAYIWCNNSYTDLSVSSNRAKFWDSTNSRPYSLGNTGTATGLSQPLFYHYGNTATFPTNNGTQSYTLTTLFSMAAPTDTTGPTATVA